MKLPENFSSGEKADEVEAFFASNKFSGVDRAVAQCVEKIRINEAWLKRDSEEIEAFLSSY